jgi:hypothetical protein
MLLKHAGLTLATLTFCAAVDLAPAVAQAPNCADMYNRTMGLYQAAPASPEYAQMAAAYSASCVGPSATPAYSTPAYGYAPGYAPSYGYAPAYVGVPIGVGIGFGGGYHDGEGGWRR